VCIIPTYSRQREVMEKINASYNKIDDINKSVKIAQAHCEKLNQSILAKAFRGELVEQNPNDEPAERLLTRVIRRKNENV